MKPETQEWLEKAEGDLKVAQWEGQATDPVYDAVCFHAQQCAEQYLKALLEEHNSTFPRIHDLLALLNLIVVVFVVGQRGVYLGKGQFWIDTSSDFFGRQPAEAAGRYNVTYTDAVPCNSRLATHNTRRANDVNILGLDLGFGHDNFLQATILPACQRGTLFILD